ncbi:MAG: hypothetical protein JRI23_06865 [Deltaproteobacteria bacterium]|jgi:rhodanese-related sulfurtransferase/rubrerythrin|nr:hypothetical protein [Deltaproteobacteria bacterium]MBW2531308.1 hypothetical protein [Deltaproteobacteria bacterium]
MASPFFAPVPQWDMSKAKAFLRDHKLEEYTLLDVRQPDEFASGHLPGATSIPLSELPQRVGELERDKRLLVYCRSGGRAGNAVAFLHQAGLTEAVNIGGTMQYDGLVATGPPEAGMAIFDAARGPEDYIALAWLLEEGARAFYVEWAERLPEHRGILEELATGEEHHKAALQKLYAELTGRDETPSLSDPSEAADLMEGGIPRKEAMAWLEGKGPADLFEFTAAMEANAHDRYLRLGQQLGGAAQRVFSEIAEAEKVHLDRLLAAFQKALT